ncbi:MAG: threonylcarbamoyl-AMP synthase [Deltaproteobacteria bacterium]|nr:MAG: threonylcarbamoyl-AMP synthase [Deltaproteobacteria bacterium]
MTKIINVDPLAPEVPALEEAVEVLREGGIIAYPTETFYGLGADAFSENAIKRLYRIKGRDENKPISILIKDQDMLKQVTENIPPGAEVLMQEFWPGPLTLIFKGRDRLPSGLTGGTGKIGVRISSQLVARRILEIFELPITTTSANVSGRKSPVTAQEILGISDGIDLILDGGRLPGQKGSTIVDFTLSPPEIVREGEIPGRVIMDFLEK